MKSLHKCAAPSCSRCIPTRLLMCIEHWRMVPAPLARAVNHAHSAMRKAPNGTAAIQGVSAYRLAVQQAVNAVARA